MIHIDKNTYIPSVSETLGILRVHNQHMPQLIDFDKTVQYISWLVMKVNKISKPLWEAIKYSPTTAMTPDTALKNYLINTGNAAAFRKVKTGLSLSKPSVEQAIESGTLSEECITIIRAYQQMTNYQKTARTLEGLLQHPISDAYSFDGHRMLIIQPEWAEQNTGRVAMRNPAIQNFPHGVQDIITVPKGYILLHTDSGQIEPRTVYSAYLKDPQIKALINLYNDAYYGLLHYITMPETDILSGRTDFEKHEITDDMKDNRKRIKTYSNAVMYGSKSNPSGDPIKEKMIRRIGGHPLRQNWVQDVERQVQHGVRVFKTAFGTPINIANSAKLEAIDNSYYDGEDMLEEEYNETSVNEMIKLAINNPIQGTAADLMRVSVSQANRLIMEKGKKSFIINYVHDAGTFAIHEDDYDKIADELADIVHYDIDGWIPIYAEPEYGRNGGLFDDLY